MNALRWPKIMSVGVVLALLLLIAAPAALAFEGRGGRDVVVAANEVIDDDLYVAASSLTINGTVKGDVIFAGARLVINGNVEGSVMGAAQELVINGTVAGAARLTGWAITLGQTAKVSRDLMAAGYSLEMAPGSAVGRDLFFAGMQTLLAGSVARRGNIGAQGVELRGSFGGDVEVDVGSAASTEMPPTQYWGWNMPAVPSVRSGLHLGEDAKIGGNLEYTSREQLSTQGVVAGQTTWREAQPPRQQETRGALAGLAILNWLLNPVRRFIALFLIGLLFIFAIPLWTQRLAENVEKRPLPSLGWGFVALCGIIADFILIAVATVLLALLFGVVTLGGLAGLIAAIGVVLFLTLALLFTIAIAYAAQIVISYLLGHLILGKAGLSPVTERVLALFLGVIIVVILTAIPCVGGLINLAIALFGLGALWLLARDLLTKRPAAVAAQQ